MKERDREVVIEKERTAQEKERTKQAELALQMEMLRTAQEKERTEQERMKGLTECVKKASPRVIDEFIKPSPPGKRYRSIMYIRPK